MSLGTRNGLLIFGSAVAVSVGVALSPADVLDAAAVVATVVLVGVTTWYVVLTRELVEAQGRTLEHAREVEERRSAASANALQRQGYVEIWQVCNAFVFAVDALANRLSTLTAPEGSFEEAKRAVSALYDDHNDEFSEVASQLTAATLNLPDGQIHTLTWEVSVRVMRSANLLSRLQLATLEAEFDARTEEREPRLRDIENLWAVKFRPQSPDRTEWSDLVSGDAFRLTETRLGELQDLAFNAARKGVAG